MSEWRPIETAPRDGASVILGCNYDRHGKQRVTVAWWDDGVAAGVFGRWVEAKHFDDYEDDWIPHYCEFRPSHWMPLPAPPEQEAEE